MTDWADRIKALAEEARELEDILKAFPEALPAPLEVWPAYEEDIGLAYVTAKGIADDLAALDWDIARERLAETR